MKKIFTLSLLVIILTFAFCGVALAGSSAVSIVPAFGESTFGAPFNVSVQVNPINNKVCVVKGTINFTNLSCQNITLADGVITQTAPSCATPNFTIGIPKCTTVPKDLFFISVKGTETNLASVFFTNVKIIGTSNDLPQNLQNGIFNIKAIPQVEKPLIAPETSAESNSTDIITQATGTVATTTIATTTTKLAELKNSIVASVAAAGEVITSMSYFAQLVIIIIVFSLGYIIYRYSRKNKVEVKKEETNK